jgi:hypothetical protein
VRTLAGKSTVNRLELSRPEPTRYHNISYDAAAIESLFFEPMRCRRRRSSSTSTPLTTRCTGIRRSVLTTTAATCRSTCSAAGIWFVAKLRPANITPWIESRSRLWVWEAVVQRRRDGRAALRLMRKLLKKQGFVPKLLVTDKLRSYAFALRRLRLTCRHEARASEKQ